MKDWFDGLPEGLRKSAESLIATLTALPVDVDEDRKLLYWHGILAFERMRIRGSTDEFVGSIDDVDKLLRLLADRDALEAALYRDIAKSRLEAIEVLQEIVDEDAKEKVCRSIW